MGADTTTANDSFKPDAQSASHCELACIGGPSAPVKFEQALAHFVVAELWQE